MLREDGECAYAIAEGVPVLLGPEAYVRNAALPSTDLPQYAEAYSEMAVYNQVADERRDARHESHQRSWMAAAAALAAPDRARFPEPAAVWCDQLYEFAAQRDAYRALAPLRGKRVLQLGGTGIHALKFLLAGAPEAWLATPTLGEALFTVALARIHGLLDRFHPVIAIGEELPFADASFQAIYSSSCLHHMVTGQAGREARRLLVEGGVFAAIDPWRAPLHNLGTGLVGKREHGVHCRPLDASRVQAFRKSFAEASCVRYGALLRYPLLGLQKSRLTLSDRHVRALLCLDDTLCRWFPYLRRLGSAALVCARREGRVGSTS